MMKIKQSVAKREASVTSSMRSHIQLQKIRLPNGKKKKKKTNNDKNGRRNPKFGIFLV